MTLCDRCGATLHIGDYPFCRGNSADHAPSRQVIWADDIPGGVEITNGLCNADGTPRRYYSRSDIRDACRAKGLIPWTDVYTEDRTKDARVHDEWLKSGEAQRAKRDRDEARAEKRLARR